jgi:hypothetical protein
MHPPCDILWRQKRKLSQNPRNILRFQYDSLYKKHEILPTSGQVITTTLRNISYALLLLCLLASNIHQQVLQYAWNNSRAAERIFTACNARGFPAIVFRSVACLLKANNNDGRFKRKPSLSFCQCLERDSSLRRKVLIREYNVPNQSHRVNCSACCVSHDLPHVMFLEIIKYKQLKLLQCARIS